MTEIIGYARVSTSDQSLDLQTDALKNFGCHKIFVEKQTGLKIDRPIFRQCLDYLRAGDTLVVWKLDRIGRRAGPLMNIVEDLQKKNIAFVSLKENLRPDSPMATAMMQMICVFSEMERNIIAERTKAGLEQARKKGNLKLGRPRKIEEEDKILIKALMTENISVSKIAKRFKVDPSTIWRAVGSKASNYVEPDPVRILK